MTKAKVKEYKLTHQQGMISIENISVPMPGTIEGDLGIQIAEDGRVWVCINGVAFLRFRPYISIQRGVKEVK